MSVVMARAEEWGGTEMWWGRDGMLEEGLLRNGMSFPGYQNPQAFETSTSESSSALTYLHSPPSAFVSIKIPNALVLETCQVPCRDSRPVSANTKSRGFLTGRDAFPKAECTRPRLGGYVVMGIGWRRWRFMVGIGGVKRGRKGRGMENGVFLCGFEGRIEPEAPDIREQDDQDLALKSYAGAEMLTAITCMPCQCQCLIHLKAVVCWRSCRMKCI